MTLARRARTKAEPRHKAPIYWKKALRFSHAAKTNAAEKDWDPSVSNAANAVINLVDAVCVHYHGARSSSDSHLDALNLLLGVSELPTDVRNALAKHLEALLNVKNIAQYEGRLLERTDAERALLHLERALKAAQELAKGNAWGT